MSSLRKLIVDQTDAFGFGGVTCKIAAASSCRSPFCAIQPASSSINCSLSLRA